MGGLNFLKNYSKGSGCGVVIIILLLCVIVSSIDGCISSHMKNVSPINIPIGKSNRLKIGEGVLVDGCTVAVSQIIDTFPKDAGFTQIVILVSNKSPNEFEIDASDFKVFDVDGDNRKVSSSVEYRTRMMNETIPRNATYKMSIFIPKSEIGIIEYNYYAITSDHQGPDGRWITPSGCETEKILDTKKRAEEKLKKTQISTEEGYKLQDISKELVNAVLKAPSTAQYPGSWLDPYDGWALKKDGSTYEVSSYVDSQNSYGAMIRSEFYIKFKVKGESFKLKKFVFDGKSIQ